MLKILEKRDVLKTLMNSLSEISNSLDSNENAGRRLKTLACSTLE